MNPGNPASAMLAARPPRRLLAGGRFGVPHRGATVAPVTAGAPLGPPALGRGAIVGIGDPSPAALADAPRFLVDDAVLAEPEAIVTAMHERWATRLPYVVELAVDQGVLRTAAAERNPAEPYTVDPMFTFWRERLHFLVWTNTYDLRGDAPIWWWSRKAQRLGAEVTPDGPADIRLPDGTPAWCDGGPAELFDPTALGAAVVHRNTIDAGALTPAGGTPAAAELAPDQTEAVMHHRGPARIIAPAGSGKTRVLTERLRHLLTDRRVHPRTVTAVAYNKRAADEMLERTTDLGANIRTLNSLGLAIVNGTGGFAVPHGSTRRRVIDEREVRRLLDDLIELRRAPNTDPYMPYLDGLRAIRLGLMRPEHVESAVDAPGLAELFPRLIEVMAANAVIDFDGQLYEAVRVLLADPTARERAQLMARHLLVDEFQDLTPVHMLLLRLMAAPAYDVFGVGDDDQVIYGFGGATPQFLTKFETYFPGAAAHALTVNYRCPPAVVQAAGRLLAYNTDRIEKQVEPAPGRGGDSSDLTVERIDKMDEALRCRALVDAWVAQGAGYDDIAVLARVNSALLPVQLTFREAGIPSRAPLDRSILERTGMRTALAYLRIGLDPGAIRAADLTETVRRPSRRISRNVVEMLTKRSRTSVSDIRRLASRLSGGDTTKLLEYADDLDLVVRSVAGGDTVKVFRTIRVRVGLGEAMDVLDGVRGDADRSTHADDLAALEQVAALHRDPATFERWLVAALDDRPTTVGGVELSTIHRVKGREWPRVIVFGVDQGLLPHRRADDIDEERRLLHVAITRGRTQVVVLADEAEPSPFLAELDGTRARVPLGAPRRPAAAPAPAKAARGGGGAPALDITNPEAVAARDALREWRRQTAAATKLPAYIVLYDAHIDDIANRRPATPAELATCAGIGPTKLDRWGDEILAVLDGVRGG